ncbi:MAG: F0F1 ATP synthase subunit A [Candidatus Eisenbacteria bacterium]|nr:F0F1 ATP synthase subunit A [Candidatus Eisenbacteria bacterium]
MILPLLEAAAGETPLEFPNIITLFAHFSHNEWVKRVLEEGKWQDMVFTWVVVLFLASFFFLASRRRSMLPGKLQNLAEMLVEGLHDFIVGIMGPQGKDYVPFLGSLFIYILAMNLVGLIPGMKSPTANPNTTLSMALVVFLYAQWTGIRHLGIVGYLDHMAGEPRDLIGWCMVPLMFPLHLIGELAKPISLACRLFGNIFGEDILLAVFAGLGIMVLQLMHIPYGGLPLQLPFMFLALLTSVVQALIFTLLSTIYIFLMLPHGTHETSGHGQTHVHPVHD